MAEANEAGNAGKIDVAAIVKTVTEEVNKQVSSQLGEIVKNQKILADTLEAQGKALAEVAKAKPAEGAQTPDDVKRIVQEAIAADRQSQQQSAEQKAAREAFVKDARHGLAKLPAEYTARLGNDPAKWEAEAKEIVGSWEKFVKDAGITVPNVGGGVNRDGGTTANEKPAPVANAAFLGENTAKQAAGIKLPA